MEFRNKAAEDFYENSIDMKRVEEVLQIVIGQLNLKEIFKMLREIAYDQVCYYNEELKGVLYNGLNGEYSQLHIEQSTSFQRFLRSSCDLFIQSIIDKRVFEIDYFDTFNAKLQTHRLGSAEEKIRKLESIIEDYENGQY